MTDFQAPQPTPCGGREYCGSFPFCPCGGPEPLPERDPAKPATEQGIFRKFDVRRTDGSDGPGGKHEGCEYFVLDVTHDQHAPAALAAYAQACGATHPQLAADMRERYSLRKPAAIPAPEGAPALTEDQVVGYLDTYRSDMERVGDFEAFRGVACDIWDAAIAARPRTCPDGTPCVDCCQDAEPCRREAPSPAEGDAPPVPAAVWAVENKTTLTLFAQRSDAQAFASRFPASICGGMTIYAMPVIGSQAQPKGTEAPALPAVAEARGFVAFGAGVYRACQTVEPGLVVTFRRQGEEDRAVGERNAAPDLTPIPPEEIIVRLEFRNVAGLDSLEDHLREIRQQHWPESVPNLLVDAMAHANANAWAVTKEWARGWNDARLAIAKAHLVPSPAVHDGKEQS